MQVKEHDMGGWIEIELNGRLDSLWAGHLASDIDACMRRGCHHIRVNMAQVSYISSAGIRTLLRAHKQLFSIGGSFAVTKPSDQAASVLKLGGLNRLVDSGGGRSSTEAPEAGRPEKIAVGAMSFDVYRTAGAADMDCRVVGDPGRLGAGAWQAKDIAPLQVSGDMIAVGIGAFGGHFEESRARFGDFVAAGGAAAYLPADGSGAPDYQLAAGSYVPEVSALFASVAQGEFSLLARFEAARNERRGATLTQLVEAALDIADRSAVGTVIVAESAGLIGAALKRSPVLDEKGGLFDYPGIREWLTFIPERVHDRESVLVAGMAARSAASLASALRPLGAAALPAGHFHAAVFPFRPLPNGRIGLKESVSALFEAGAPKDILHLLADLREMEGGSESEFVRGAMWVGGLKI